MSDEFPFFWQYSFEAITPHVAIISHEMFGVLAIRHGGVLHKSRYNKDDILTVELHFKDEHSKSTLTNDPFLKYFTDTGGCQIFRTPVSSPEALSYFIGSMPAVMEEMLRQAQKIVFLPQTSADVGELICLADTKSTVDKFMDYANEIGQSMLKLAPENFEDSWVYKGALQITRKNLRMLSQNKLEFEERAPGG